MKIGILGGSFDPMHYGHLNMAKRAKEEYDLDIVYIMPAGHSPNKDESQMTDAIHRVRMCELMIQEEDGLKISTYEVDKAERSYTYITLSDFKDKFPDDELYFIMGADSLDYFDCWKNPDIICQKAIVLVVNRGDFKEKDLLHKIEEINALFPADIRIVHCEKTNISSSEIRSRLKSNQSLEGILPIQILAYIKEHHLYHL